MGGRGGQSLRDQSGALKQATAVGAGVGPMAAGEEAVGGEATFGPDGTAIVPPEAGGHVHGQNCKHGRAAHRQSHGSMGIGRFCVAATRTMSGPLLQILGLDRFTKGKALGGMKRAGRDQNPFDMGFVKVGLRFGLRNRADVT